MICQTFGEYVRTCDTCGDDMLSGYCVYDGMEYYCSDDCLHSAFSSEEIQELYESDLLYYTEWYE